MTRHTRFAPCDSTCDVFVYGTLRHGEINDIALAAGRFGRPDLPAPVCIATGRVPGRLVDFGSWPGLLPLAALPAADGVQQQSIAPSCGAPTVIGEVYRIDVALLPILDEIEGIRPDGSRDAFYRDEVEVAVVHRPDADACDGVGQQMALAQDEKEGVTSRMNPQKSSDAHRLRCYFYPIDGAASVGLPAIPGGDWIAYRLSRNS